MHQANMGYIKNLSDSELYVANKQESFEQMQIEVH